MKSRRRREILHRRTSPILIAVVIASVMITSVVIMSVVVMVMAVPVVIVIGTLGKPPCEVRILFNQQLRRTFRPNEDRVRVEPDIRIGLNVKGHLLDAVDGSQMRRACRVCTTCQSIVDVEQRAAGAV